MKLSNTKPPVWLLLYFWGREHFSSPESDPLIAAPTRTGATSVTHLPDEPTCNVSNVQMTEATLQPSCCPPPPALRSKVAPRSINKSLTHTNTHTSRTDVLPAAFVPHASSSGRRSSSSSLKTSSSCCFSFKILFRIKTLSLFAVSAHVLYFKQCFGCFGDSWRFYFELNTFNGRKTHYSSQSLVLLYVFVLWRA